MKIFFPVGRLGNHIYQFAYVLSKTKKNEEEDQTPTPTKTDQLFSPGVRHIKDFANNNSNNPAGEPIFEN